MKKLYRAIAIVAAAASLDVAAVSCNPEGREFTVMSYNVGVFSKYSIDSKADVAALVLECGADAVALCELDSCNRRHPEYQLEALADTLGGWNYAFAGAFPFAGGSYGNGIVTRDRMLSRHSVALPRGEGSEPRSLSVVETPCYVLGSVHLDYTSDEVRLAQLEVLEAWFEANYTGCGKPVLLCGDFNALPRSRTIRSMSGNWECLSPAVPTFPSNAPDRCIDYIWHLRRSAPVKVLEIFTFESSTLARTASDHLPVALRLRR